MRRVEPAGAFSQTNQAYPVAVDALRSSRPRTIGTRSVYCANLVGGFISKMLRYRPTLSINTVRARIATPRRATTSDR